MQQGCVHSLASGFRFCTAGRLRIFRVGDRGGDEDEDARREELGDVRKDSQLASRHFSGNGFSRVEINRFMVDIRREITHKKRGLVKFFTKSLHPFCSLPKVQTPSPKTIISRPTLKIVCFQISV